MHAHAAQNYARHTRLRAREIAATIRKARNAACVERLAVARLSPRAHTKKGKKKRGYARDGRFYGRERNKK